MQKQSQLGLLLALTFGANILLNKAPLWVQLLTVPIGMYVILKIIQRDGISRSDSGLTRANTKSGVLYGGVVSLVIISVLSLTFLVSPDIFSDPRYNQATGPLLVSLLVVLPLRTVLLEEFLFRGVYYAYFKSYKTLYALGIPSLIFGMWHILPSLDFKTLTLPIINFVVPHALTSIGTVIVTALAGVFFLLLRIKSKSLLAPILVHYTINATAMILAFLSFK